MKKYGVFISHNHMDWMLAGRVYDFFDKLKCCPFFDIDSMHSGHFEKEIKYCVENTPYFICILTKNTLKGDWVRKEIQYALKSKREIILIATEGFKWPEQLPEEISEIKKYHIHTVNQKTYIKTMNTIYENDIDKRKIDTALDWVDRIVRYNNTYVASREEIEQQSVTLEDRFGENLIKNAKDGTECDGDNHIKFIHMSCYAANIVFTPKGTMVDERAYDHGLMSKIFKNLFKDEEFALEIIINAPFSYAAQEAVENERIGNSSLEENPQIAFLASYVNMMNLIESDPVYKKAYREKRFRFMVTDKCLPYSIFHVKYKLGFEEHNHVKLDLYSENMVSNMDRRCMIFTEKNNKLNYDFFVSKYDYIRNLKKSKELIEEKHELWKEKWQKFIEEEVYDV